MTAPPARPSSGGRRIRATETGNAGAAIMGSAFDTSTQTVILAGIAVGLTGLLLVAGELGRRAGLSVFGRAALACGLGLGVIAFSLKAAILIYLQTLGRDDLVAAASERVRIAAAGPAVKSRRTTPMPSISPTVWRTLPATAPIPRDNPQTPDKVALGRKLFFDPALSADGTVSCASCHILADGGDDNAPLSTGVDDRTGDRNAPTVINAAFLSRLFWDGRAASLEAQARGPLVNPKEMAMPSLDAVVRRVERQPGYAAEFRRVFGGKKPVSIVNITRAIAAFERTLVAPASAYDRYVAGDDGALSAQQLRGMALFDANGCRGCHADPLFSAADRSTSSGAYRVFPVFPDNDLVRKYGLLIDGKPRAWRVPSLRNVAVTAPYFHNGSVDTLEEAIRVMAVSQLRKKLSDDPADDLAITSTTAGAGAERRLTTIRDRALSDGEIADIAAFLESLTALPADGAVGVP